MKNAILAYFLQNLPVHLGGYWWTDKQRNVWRWVVLGVCCGIIILLALSIVSKFFELLFFDKKFNIPKFYFSYVLLVIGREFNTVLLLLLIPTNFTRAMQEMILLQCQVKKLILSRSFTFKNVDFCVIQLLVFRLLNNFFKKYTAILNSNFNFMLFKFGLWFLKIQ